MVLDRIPCCIPALVFIWGDDFSLTCLFNVRSVCTALHSAIGSELPRKLRGRTVGLLGRCSGRTLAVLCAGGAAVLAAEGARLERPWSITEGACDIEAASTFLPGYALRVMLGVQDAQIHLHGTGNTPGLRILQTILGSGCTHATLTLEGFTVNRPARPIRCSVRETVRLHMLGGRLARGALCWTCPYGLRGLYVRTSGTVVTGGDPISLPAPSCRAEVSISEPKLCAEVVKSSSCCASLRHLTLGGALKEITASDESSSPQLSRLSVIGTLPGDVLRSLLLFCQPVELGLATLEHLDTRVLSTLSARTQVLKLSLKGGREAQSTHLSCPFITSLHITAHDMQEGYMDMWHFPAVQNVTLEFFGVRFPRGRLFSLGKLVERTERLKTLTVRTNVPIDIRELCHTLRGRFNMRVNVYLYGDETHMLDTSSWQRHASPGPVYFVQATSSQTSRLPRVVFSNTESITSE